MRSVYLPNQHGAWAMLAVPLIFGTFAGGAAPLHIWLAAAWLLAYFASFFLLQFLKTKNRRFQKPLVIYGTLLLPAAVVLLTAKPEMAWFAFAFLPLFAVNAYYAKRNRERSLANDIVAVVQFSLILLLSYSIGGGQDWTLALSLFLFNILYFVGTVLYIKTMIREKNNPVYYRASVAFHLAYLVVSLLWFPAAFAIPAGAALIRAVVSPRLTMSVKQCGMLEFAYAAVFTFTVLVTCTGF